MLNPDRSRCSRCRGEEGSIILAVTVILVATIAILATLSTVESGLRSARTDQNRTNAFQLANGGIDQAVYRLDTGTLPAAPSGTYVPTLSAAGKVIAFTEQVTVGTSRYDVTATATPATQTTKWTVNSVGTDTSGRQRQAVATVQATPLFVNGFFTDKTFYLTGNQDNPIAYDSAVCPDPRIPSPSAACVLPTPINGSLGTNSTFEGSTMTTASFASRWSSFNMYGRATQEDADLACDVGRCGTFPKVNAITNRLPVGRKRLPAAIQACPNGGVLSGTTATPYVIPPGRYLCTDLQLSGVVNVGTSGTGVAEIWIDENFNAAANSKINEGGKSTNLYFHQRPLCSSVDDPATTPCILAASTPGAVCDAEIWAQMYLPALEIDCTGEHQPEIYGAVVANIHAGTGNHFDFHWDIQSQYAVNDGLFVIRNWRECPPSAGVC